MTAAKMTAKTVVRARKAPARKVASEPLVRWRELRLAAGLAVLVLAAASLSRPGAPPRPETAAPFANIEIPEADRARIDSWPKFFACYDLTSPQGVMTATLRAADYAHHPTWRADAMIQVPLAPPALTPTPTEAAVLLQASELAQQRAVPGADPCAGAAKLAQATLKSDRHPGSGPRVQPPAGPRTGSAAIRDRHKEAASSWRSRLSSLLRRLTAGMTGDDREGR